MTRLVGPQHKPIDPDVGVHPNTPGRSRRPPAAVVCGSVRVQYMVDYLGQVST